MGLKILAVDDEPEVLKLIKTMVEPLGYEVVTLADSREAVRRLEREKFDGVLVDVVMPYLDGFELTRRLRASPLNAGVPIIMITGRNDAESMRKGFSLGVTFFLAKPFTSDRLYNLFNAVRGSMLRERRRHARLPFSTTVQCTFGERGEKRVVSRSVNLGETGMLLEPSGGLDVGQEVALEFLLPQVSEPREAAAGKPARPEAGPRKVRAKVIRKDAPDRIAVEFASLSAEDGEAIQRFITGSIKL